MNAEERIGKVERRVRTVEEAIVLLTALTDNHNERLEDSLMSGENLNAKISALIDAQIASEDRILALVDGHNNLESKMSALVDAQIRSEAGIKALIQAQANSDNKISALAEAQNKTESGIQNLTELVEAAHRRLNVIDK